MNDDVKYMLGLAVVLTVGCGLQGGWLWAAFSGLWWFGIAIGMSWYYGRVDVCRKCRCGNCLASHKAHPRL